MASSNKHLHITLDERRIIEIGIRNNSTKTAIARTLGKDKSTIAREIRLHATAHISVPSLWNATITSTAGLAAIAALPALVSFPSPVTGGIDPLVPVMAAPSQFLPLRSFPL